MRYNMSTAVKVFIFSTAFSFLVVGAFLSNIAFEKQEEVVEQQRILQRDWVTFSLDKDNESMHIIKMQGHRVELLESKLEVANNIMHDKDDEVTRRGELLESTALQLQKTIDNLANALKDLDEKTRAYRNRGIIIASLRSELKRCEKELRQLKCKFDSTKSINQIDPPTLQEVIK